MAERISGGDLAAADANAGEPVEISVFDTRLEPRESQFSLWRDSIGVLFDIQADETDAREGYRAQLDSALVDGTMVTRVQAGQQAFGRNALRACRDGIDGVMFQVFSKGGVRQLDDSMRLAGAGAITGFDLTRNMQTVNDDFDLVSIIFPRHLVETRLGVSADIHLNTVGRDSAISRLTSGYLVSLQAALRDMSRAEAQTSVQAALDLIVECYEGKTRRAPDHEAADLARLLQAKNFIRSRIALRCPVDPHAVQGFLGCSRATLYRHFAPVGGVAGFIRSERLRAALRDLARDSLSKGKISIGETALRHGFESDTHFSRIFKAEFGMSPRDARQAFMARPPGRQRNSGKGSADRRYELWLKAISA